MSLGLAAVLFGALRWLTRLQPGLWWLGYTTAVVAVMLAAQGFPWRRKLLFSGLTAALSLGLLELVAHSGLGSAADALTNSGAQAATDLQLASFVVIQMFFLAMPLAALALFVGRRPTRLWSRS